jgi:hypothetical protein
MTAAGTMKVKPIRYQKAMNGGEEEGTDEK